MKKLITVTQQVDVDVDVYIEEALHDMSRAELLSLRKVIDLLLEGEVQTQLTPDEAAEQIYLAAQLGHDSRVIDVARRWAADTLGRVL